MGEKKVPPQWREKEEGILFNRTVAAEKKGIQIVRKGEGEWKKGIILYYGPRCVGCKITKFDELDTSGILKGKKNQSVTKMAEKVNNNYFTVY